MSCDIFEDCGGCKYRQMTEQEYHDIKIKNFLNVITGIKAKDYCLNQPVFVTDGSRRRASFAFSCYKDKFVFGFNKEASKEIVDIKSCPLMTSQINKILPKIRRFLQELCCEKYTEKQGKKFVTKKINSGDVFVCEADNGIDIVLDIAENLNLNHRMLISEFCSNVPEIIRVSHRQNLSTEAEVILEKMKPIVKMGKYDIFIPAGTFLQPSQEGQEILSNLVLQGLQGVSGIIADLFCGVGTFSYVLCNLPKVKIIAADSSKALLKGFEESVNKNQISNIKIIQRNLFKYPFEGQELKDVSAVVFDPPRAGAKALCQALATTEFKPETIIAVSCHPATFVNDANILIDGCYELKEITMVDQFIYSNHSELVARFTKR